MHDAVTLEKRGIPTVLMISRPFLGNAQNMARLQGIPDYPFIVLPHRVGTLDKQGIDELVAQFFPHILGMLLARPKTGP